MQALRTLGYVLLALAIPTAAAAGGFIPDDFLCSPLWLSLPILAITVMEVGLLRRLYKLDIGTAIRLALWIYGVTLLVPNIIIGWVGFGNHAALFPVNAVSFALVKPWITGGAAWEAWGVIPWSTVAGYLLCRTLYTYLILAVVSGEGQRLEKLSVLPVLLAVAIALTAYMFMLFAGLLFVEPYYLFDPSEL